MLNRLLRGPRVAFGGLAVASLVACADDSTPFGPEAPAAEAAPSPMASLASWVGSVAMPTKRMGLVAATVNGIVYAIGGQTQFPTFDSLPYGAKVTKVEAFNPTTGKWVSKASLPAKRAWSSGAAVINGKIYVPGGLNSSGSPTKTLYVYDPSTNTWSTKAPVPTATARGASAVIGGKLYVLTPKATTSVLHRYDPGTNTWTARASVSRAHIYPVSGVIDGKLYIAGTMNPDKSPQYGTSVYDPGTNAWTFRQNIPGARIGGSGAVLDNKLYIFGGGSMPGTMESSVVKVFYPATNNWVETMWMPTARSFHATATVNGVVYALGGQLFESVLAINDRFTP